MTVLQVQMMLHYYAIAEPYAVRQPEHAGSPAVRDQRASLINLNLLEVDDTWPSGFRVTERGKAYVEAVGAMPLPVCKWVMP